MENIVELRDISKAFSGVPVLEKINFNVKKNSVHALVGGNGAGKSTLMKILAGLYQPDGGEIWIKKQKVHFRNPSDAHNQGIYLVPQEPMLYPYMTVEENILLGMPGQKKDYKTKLKSLMESLNCDFSLNQYAEELTIAKQQQVELIRGLIRETAVIILDEPTSALTAKETEALFNNIKNLKRKKEMAFIYITHRLNELFEIADEVTILKDKKVVSTGPIKEYTKEYIIKVMVPDVDDSQKSSKKDIKTNIDQVKEQKDTVLLEIEDLSGDGFRNISFKLRIFEILGVTGIVGAGRTELAETIFGLRDKSTGTIKLQGKKVDYQEPKDAINDGIVYVPEDRHLHGGFLEASIKHNISSSILDKLSKIFIKEKKEASIACSYIKSLNIKSNSEEQKLIHLSGGNQQKVVLGKWLAAQPKVIILDEPTRGIDANAREEIYAAIQNLAKQGIGIIVISSDFEEIVRLSDRVMVMYNGRKVSEITPPNIDLKNITFASFGHVKEGV